MLAVVSEVPQPSIAESGVLLPGRLDVGAAHGDRAHPYHESCTHRCADQRFPRSPATVERQVMCSTSAGSYIGSYQLCRRYLVHVRLNAPYGVQAGGEPLSLATLGDPTKLGGGARRSPVARLDGVAVAVRLEGTPRGSVSEFADESA